MKALVDNPKDVCGERKAPMSTVPAGVMMEAGVALFEGARKYGRHNYRVAPVRASRYYDALMRHIMAKWEGEDTDEKSGMDHLAKAIASLIVWRDAEMQGTLIDDRPPSSNPPSKWLGTLNEIAEELVDRIPDPVPSYTAREGNT